MKPVFWVIILLPVAAVSQTVEPEYREKWGEIETHIRNNWLRYVDYSPASLPCPYSYALNPGTLYYWDLYFINEGLAAQGFMEQARNNLDNFIYEIEHLGFVPNALGWGEDRSQTPYFAMMARSYYEKCQPKDTVWLQRAYHAALSEYAFWTNANGNLTEDHRTPQGLQHYSHHADSAALLKFYEQQNRRWPPHRADTREEKIRTAAHRLAEAETMDFTPRFEGRCMDFIAVDLNANLYQYEINLDYFERELGIRSGTDWEGLARQRVERINRYCWDEEKGFFYDYDYKNHRRSCVAAISALMPLYWGFATAEQAERVKRYLPLFDSPGGLTVCEPVDGQHVYQWGDQAVWPPVQYIAMTALLRYRYVSEARQVALKYLNTVTRNFVKPEPAVYPPFKYGDGVRRAGFLYEKYTRAGDILDAEYPCSEMMGWAAATFLKALEVMQLSP
ncbi:MAG: trehalase [Tannerella sp.]|jgi:alpha,alpha-trehalase|nr:trehalase [Tannerella sp.]